MTKLGRMTAISAIRRLHRGGNYAAILVTWVAAVMSVTAFAQTLKAPEQAIVEFSSADLRKSFHVLNRARFEQRLALRSAALARLNDTDAHIRYAAIYALAITADAQTGATALAGLLGSSSSDERLLAA